MVGWRSINEDELPLWSRHFSQILERSKTCLNSWPRYALFEEDFSLMKEKWNEKYKGKRVVMWDNTKVNLSYMPSGADD